MSLPALYFRIRDNGAAVFRVVEDMRQGRLDLEPLAIANVRSGDVRVQGGREMSDGERGEIEAWIAARQEELAAREAGDVTRTIEQINATAHWVQSRASDEDVARVADGLLLAMHDLRGAIARRQSGAVDTGE